MPSKSFQRQYWKIKATKSMREQKIAARPRFSKSPPTASLMPERQDVVGLPFSMEPYQEKRAGSQIPAQEYSNSKNSSHLLMLS